MTGLLLKKIRIFYQLSEEQASQKLDIPISEYLLMESKEEDINSLIKVYVKKLINVYIILDNVVHLTDQQLVLSKKSKKC